jgi:hypothetical protein
MRIYSKLNLIIASLALSACQTSELRQIKSSSENQLNCLTYQKCDITGTLKIEGSGDYASYYVMSSKDRCLPLLIDKKNRSELQKSEGKQVQFIGLLLMRQSDGPPDTVSINYFDRSLPAYGVCKNEANVLYLTRYVDSIVRP